MDSEIKHSFVASEIVAAAASYLWSRYSKSQQESGSNDTWESENQLEKETENMLQVPKTELAAHGVAATFTAIVKIPVPVVKENRDLSRVDLLTFHSSPFEWFICDDAHKHTRILVIQKYLDSPLGKLYILQPSERSSPSHPLIPRGSGLYALDSSEGGNSSTAMISAFLNCPPPVETLFDLNAYGYEGTVPRDHDTSSYLRAINGVLRRNKMSFVRRTRTERSLLWPLLVPPSPHSRSRESNSEATS